VRVLPVNFNAYPILDVLDPVLVALRLTPAGAPVASSVGTGTVITPTSMYSHTATRSGRCWRRAMSWKSGSVTSIEEIRDLIGATGLVEGVETDLNGAMMRVIETSDSSVIGPDTRDLVARRRVVSVTAKNRCRSVRVSS